LESFAPSGPEDHGHVRVHRRRLAQRQQHVHLARRVVQVVVAADHVRDAHVGVVHHHAEVVGRRAVRARDDEVVEFLVLERHRAVDHVLDDGRALFRVLEAHHGLATRGGPRALAVAAAAVVARLFLARLLIGAHDVQLFLGAVAVIGRAGLDHLRDDFLVPVETLRLVERPLIVLQSQPLHAFEDDLHRLGRGALEVRVLDAQDELPLHAAGVEPAEQRRAHTSYMEHARGAGSEARDDGHRWLKPGDFRGANGIKAVPGKGFRGLRAFGFDSAPRGL
jgi:hypothetical protein